MARKKRKTGRKILVLVLLLAGIGGLAWWAKLNKKEVILSVKTETVERRDITEEVVSTGRIQPVTQVKISPEVSGEIIDLPVKEGQLVDAGDLLLKIRPDFYEANLRSAKANHESAQANETLSELNLDKARIDYQRERKLYDDGIGVLANLETVSNAWEIAKARLKSAQLQTVVADAALTRANEDLAKTTIHAPMYGAVSQLLTEKGERVVGTATMAGTHVITIADLKRMEARVEIGEMDIVLIKVGQKVRLEVDAFSPEEFTGTVTEIANSALVRGSGMNQEATKFEVRIRVDDAEAFRPGMSVTAYIQTRSRTNVVTAPIQSVTTRLPKADKGTNAAPAKVEAKAKSRKAADDDKKKPIEVVFLAQDGVVKMVPVERGISDDDYVEITAGLEGGEKIVSGGYKAINRELEDGKKILVEGEGKEKSKTE